MKTYITTFLAAVLLIACETNTSVDIPVNQTSTSGNISLVFDKTSIPSEVASIVVVLSRQGYDSFKKQTNVLNDSSAEILFDNVAVGMWSVDIKAYGIDNLVKYAGTSQAQVNEGTVTNLSMVLQPVTTGVGGVQIVVKWGTAPIVNWNNWVHNPSNPILKKGESYFDILGVGQPFVFNDDGVWKMTYASIGVDTIAKRNIASIGLATTIDGGLTWKKNPKPILTVGNSDWNNYSIAPGPIYKVDNQYKMLYTGADALQRYKIGIASSSNGIDWESSPLPLFTSLGQWDHNLVAGDMIKVNGTYYFFMSCRSNDVYAFSIGLAISADGKNWKRYGTTPIISVSQQWEGQGVYFPSVIYENGKFIMMYSSTSSSASPAFGIATSIDGIHWTKLESNPVIKKGVSHTTWATTEISYPSFKKINGIYRAYYTGFKWTSTYPEWSIGYATLK